MPPASLAQHFQSGTQIPPNIARPIRFGRLVDSREYLRRDLVAVSVKNLELVTRELNQIIAQGTQLVCATHLERNRSLFNRSMKIDEGRLARLNKTPNK